MSYCISRVQSIRRHTIEVKAGVVGMGGDNPVRVQSMTTSDTQDVAATVKQSIALAQVGCEIIRVTAPNVPAARCLRDIRRELSAAGFAHIPLVADIHFLPAAAMEAIEHVEKVRVNPGNYADKKKFAVKDYSDADYERELQRLYETFSPLVLRAKELGRCLRIGTNHGSLSDRIMNRYGDTPLGMVESALEFLRIAESHSFNQMVLSMKSSNPKVMIQAYRLLVEYMDKEDMHYPLHLGVTEAGDGEDGRIKGAIGIGSLLQDGLGDTLRVSLTEDSVYEVPVARELARKAEALWRKPGPSAVIKRTPDSIDPYQYVRRDVASLNLAPNVDVNSEQPPRVVVRAPSVAALPTTLHWLTYPSLDDTPGEAVLVPVTNVDELKALAAAQHPKTLVVELASTIAAGDVTKALADASPSSFILMRTFGAADATVLRDFLDAATAAKCTLVIATTAPALAELKPIILERRENMPRCIFTLAGDFRPIAPEHPTGAYRMLAEELRSFDSAIARAPIWIRNTEAIALGREYRAGSVDFLSRLLDASILTGSLLCDGIGDMVSVETETDTVRATKLAYNILQGAGARITKTEFVACPSCGRTLFDLQTTTQRIRDKTGHLKGVKLAIMGCIVNGPGEMADADFGYVGGAPGKINLYVGKNCVQYNIPQAEADNRLIDLIKQHGKWVDPGPGVHY